ncbi:MAG: uroporphyrinogen-III C-methyltransferase [Clostridium sp.]|nr:uroporphyrinogen-III C-methyltransferase [Clostridium sp.]
MGSVTLVGAGCGKDLITVKGLKAIQSADVIVYDDLIDNDLLSFTKPDAEIIYVGKRCNKHSEKQENINNILVKKAKEDKKVIRLKGGDSFVFGRGGEEILALQRENIPYEVIPGISSSIAVPENCGIPVTHRGASQSFTVVTGHTATQTDENYQALAKLNGTLVFLMGLHNIDNICKRLIENGKDKNTPASILSKGFDKNQKRIDGTLETIADKAKSAQTPAIFVVGKVADFDFSKTIKLPLDNVSITVTGTYAFINQIAEKLTELGAYVHTCPNLKIVPNYSNIPSDFGSYTYIVFTSSNGVEIFFDYLKENRIDVRKISHLRFACIGSGSANKLSKYGFNADFIPTEYTAKALGTELSKKLCQDDKVLILRAENGSEELANALDRANINYDDVKIYNTLALNKTIHADSDYILFASASGVTAFFENAGKLNNAKPVCIGEITAMEFKKYSSTVPLIAKTHTAEGIISKILEDRNETLQTIKAE